MKLIKKYGGTAIIGALSGIINGLLGAGGGIIIAFYLSRILTSEQKQENGVFANTLATMLPISAVSFSMYLFRGYFKPEASLLYLLPIAIAGGFAGAFLLTKLKTKAVKIIFAFLVTISGLLMIFK